MTGHPYLRKLFTYNGTIPLPMDSGPVYNEDSADTSEQGDKADLDEGSAEADPEDYFQEDTDSEGERERDMYDGKPKKITGIKDKLANLPCEASKSGKLFIGLEYASDSEEDENSVINPPLKEALSMGDNMEKQTKLNKNSLPQNVRKRRSGMRFTTPPKPTISYVSESTLKELGFDYDDIVNGMNEGELHKCTAKIGDERFVCVAKCPRICYKSPKDQNYISVEKRRSEKLDNSLKTVVGGRGTANIPREGTKLRNGMVTTHLHDCMIRDWKTYEVVDKADAILAAIHAECKRLNAHNRCILVFVLNETGDGPTPNTLPVQKYEITGKDTTDKGRIGFGNTLKDGGLQYEAAKSGQYEDLKNEGCTSWGGQFYVLRCSQDEYDSTELAIDAPALFSAGVKELEKLHKSKTANQHTNNDGSTLHHIWVYTLTEKGTKGDSLYGIIKSQNGSTFGKCIGQRGGRGREDMSFKDMKEGDGGREWKSNSWGKFWIEKKKSKTDDWYRKRRIRVAPPIVKFSTVTPTPLADLDLTD